MQNELTALRPQLLETSDETERLMIKIEQDTIQVEAKKEIVACDEALGKMHALRIYDQSAGFSISILPSKKRFFPSNHTQF